MKQRAAVLGVGQTRHRSRRTDVSIAGLCREAVDRALADAGLTLADIDAVVVGKAPDLFEGVMMPELYLADALGAVGKPLLRVHTAGSVGGATGIVAASLVQAGVHRRVLAVAFEKQSESNAMWALSITPPFSMPVLAGAGGYFAPHIRSYIRRSGAPEHIGAMVAVKDRRNGACNPYAHLQQADITLESVRSSPMLWDPVRYDETCPSSDGACAVVIGDQAAAAAPGRRPPVAWIRATAMRTEPTMFAGQGPRQPPGRRRLPPRRCGGRRASPTRSRRSTWPRSTCRSPGSSRCGWRTSASPSRARAGGSPRPARPRSAAGCRSTRRAGCSAPTRSGPPACCGSPSRRCRSWARPGPTRWPAPGPRSATPTAAARSTSRCGWWRRRQPVAYR